MKQMKKEQYSSKVFINAERRLFYLFQRDTMKKIIRLENVVVAAFARNSQTPHLTLEELKQVYDTVKVKDSASMQSKAAELFPGRDPISYENICVSKGPGRAFKHGGDGMRDVVDVCTFAFLSTVCFLCKEDCFVERIDLVLRIDAVNHIEAPKDLR